MVTIEQLNLEDLAFAGRLRVQFEKMRIAAQLHSQRKPDDVLGARVLESMQVTEDLIEEAMQGWVKHHPVWTEWAKNVKGLGPMTLAAIMSRCDINRLDTVSQMWAHCGMAPGQKRVKGQKVDYDVTARVLLYRIGTGFLRAQGKFAEEYYQRKQYEVARVEAAGGQVLPAANKQASADGNMSEGHIHNRSLRYMLKVFLACLWIVWRTQEGLPVRNMYVEQRPGNDGRLHQGYDPYKYLEPKK